MALRALLRTRGLPSRVPLLARGYRFIAQAWISTIGWAATVIGSEIASDLVWPIEALRPARWRDLTPRRLPEPAALTVAVLRQRSTGC